MLAISMAPPAPHFLSRLDPVNALAILPSKNLPDLGPMTSQRPKLSLKTSDLAPTYVASTSSRNAVAVETSTAATPTTLNTFTNTFDLTYRPSPASTHPSPGASLLRRPTLHQSSPYTLNLPYGVYPILKNSPLPRDVRKPSLPSASASPRITNRRIFFPAPKKVTFKPVLEEEIVTKEYIVRHVDLSSSEDDATASGSEDPTQSSPEETEDEVEDRGIRVDELSPRGRRKRKSLAISSLSTPDEERGRDERSRSTSERRTKRKKRIWEWSISNQKKVDQGSQSETEEGKMENEPLEADDENEP